MAEINAALGARGAGHQIEALGRVLTVKPPTQRCYSDFESLLERRAFQRLRDAGYSKKQYAEELKALRKRRDALAFSWGSETCVDALQTPIGALEWQAIILRQTVKDADAEMVKRILEEKPDEWINLLQRLMHDAHGSIEKKVVAADDSRERSSTPSSTSSETSASSRLPSSPTDRLATSSAASEMTAAT